MSALVIGYGNPLRGDDGIGWQVAERLATDGRLSDAPVLQLHQLTPELAFDISTVDVAVLIDARVGPPAGSAIIERVEAAEPGTSRWTHHLHPAALVRLAHDLYGRCAVVYLIGVGVATLEAGERLSPAVQAAVAGVIESVVELVRRETRPTTGRDLVTARA